VEADSASAIVVVTKASAARRQLDAAIRFWFAEEDELAVHTVASAAYRILWDLMYHRGLLPLGEFLRTGLFSFAKDVAEGQPTPDLPSDLYTRSLIEKISEGIKAGKISSPEDIHVTGAGEKRRWDEYARYSNFLKHADRDPKANIAENDINNHDLLLRTCGTYVRLFSDSSAEMMLLHWHWVAESGEVIEGPNLALIEEIRECKPESRRKACLTFLPQVRKAFFSSPE
jgi:hypothetical protein